jgi:hypothetical protein
MLREGKTAQIKFRLYQKAPKFCVDFGVKRIRETFVQPE